MRATYARIAVLGTLLGGAALAQSPGTANGTLTVGSATIRVVHASAFAEHPGEPAVGYRILLTDKPLTPAAAKFAATAGTDDGARQNLAVELADRKIRGLEVVLAPDRSIARINVYSADAAMGMMLLQRGEFEAKSVDAKHVAGRLATPQPIQDPRIGKPIRYDVTFAADVRPATGR